MSAAFFCLAPNISLLSATLPTERMPFHSGAPPIPAKGGEVMKVETNVKAGESDPNSDPEVRIRIPVG